MPTDFFPHDLTSFQALYKQSVNDPVSFWAEYAKGQFIWDKSWNQVLDYDFNEAHVAWFKGAKLNITTNCIDRHLATKGRQTAIIWEPNEPNEAPLHISYNELHTAVQKAANMLKSLGVNRGDRVCVYMPMIPELAYTVLACARIGAIHSVVFAGFSAQSLSERINDASCKLLVTADGGYRGAKITPLKAISDDALADCASIEKVLVVQRTHSKVNMQTGRDYWWHEQFPKASNQYAAESMNAEDPLFILYTSGSTGRPKGMVHTTAGYMVYTTYTFKNVFQYQEGQVYWCTADIGWITGHSYILYGPLSAGGTTVMFEGVPSYPDYGRFWHIVEKYKVDVFYTAPTAVRALAACDLKFVNRYDLSSLKVLGSVGEPINHEAWEWYHEEIGKGQCPIVDTWWQTETGGIMISSLAGVTPEKSTFATLPMPGIQACVMDEDGNEINEKIADGKLCIKYPWPSMARTIYGDHERFKRTYFSQFPGRYFTGDGCKRDDLGNYRITGRVDDVLIVSGHNLGTAEIEDAIDEHPNVEESAVVGFPHPIKGNAIYAFVNLKDPAHEEGIEPEIHDYVSRMVGPIAKPEIILIVPSLPKTRSGKIMRRILRKMAAGERDNFGDISTLLNPEAVQHILDNINKP